MNPILRRIDELCRQYNWSHYKIAKAADIPLTSFNSMFKRNTSPTLPTIEKICDGFQISLKEFFDYENSPDGLRFDYNLLEPESVTLIKRYHNLSKSDRARLLSYLDGLEKLDKPTELT